MLAVVVWIALVVWLALVIWSLSVVRGAAGADAAEPRPAAPPRAGRAGSNWVPYAGRRRATELGQGGELNVGQLVRERHGRDATLIGFSTDHGTVTAAPDWDLPAERKRVRPGLAGSYEALFHEVGLPRFLLPLRDGAAPATLHEPHLERAIGVVYRPETERYSHYFHARLPEQFDTLLYFDETRAVEPLERAPGWETGEAPETFPFRV